MTNISRADIDAEIDFLNSAADADDEEANYLHQRAQETRLEATRLQKEINE